MKNKLRSPEAKTNSSLMKDINRIRKTADSQTRMNILRKHQIKLLNEFLHKLIKQGRITIDELKPFMPRKKQVEKNFFKSLKN